MCLPRLNTRWRCEIIVNVYGHTDVGLKRTSNEDSFYCSADEGISIVADGMGGHASGEVASALAVRVIRQEILRKLTEAHLADEKHEDPGEWLCSVLAMAIEKANDMIYRKTSSNAARSSKMGTTIVVFLATDDGCAIGHVGDSRVYILRGDKVYPMTQDHSLVNEQIRAHLITEEEARKSVYRHIVTRALGMREAVEVDTQAVVLRHGDLLLLCSDGLYDLVDDEMIRQVLTDSRDNLKNAAHSLIDLANAKGGEDNITVVLVEAIGQNPQD